MALNEDAVRKLSKAKNEPQWLLQRRLSAFRQFEKLPMPRLSYGLHVSSSLNIDLKRLRPLECVTNHMSTEVGGVIIEDLSAAAAKYEKMLKPLLDFNSSFQNKFEAMHAAFWNNGLFVYAQKRDGKNRSSVENDARIELLLGQKQTEISRVVVLADEDANVKMIESSATAENSQQQREKEKMGKHYRVEVVDVVAKQGSSVKFASVQKLGNNVHGIMSRKADVANAAKVEWIDISTGGLNIKQESVSMLNGEGSASNIVGAFFGDGSQRLDFMAKAVHNARNTTSNISMKGALKGSSKAIVQSFTKIMGNAANSESHQKAHVLLLSDKAAASPIPKLEIDNYDVKASHSASVGQLDKDKLFYLMSRGLDEKGAIRLVVEGFFEPLIRQIPVRELAEDLRRTINKLQSEKRKC